MDPFTIAALVMMVIGGATAAKGQRDAGKFQEQSFKTRAKQEEIAAKDRDLERRRKSNKILAAQIASRGATGTGFAGSLQSLAKSDAAIATLDSLANRATSEFSINSALNAGVNARRTGNLQSLSTIFNTAGSSFGVGAKATSNTTKPDLK